MFHFVYYITVYNIRILYIDYNHAEDKFDRMWKFSSFHVKNITMNLVMALIHTYLTSKSYSGKNATFEANYFGKSIQYILVDIKMQYFLFIIDCPKIPLNLNWNSWNSFLLDLLHLE